MGKKKEQGGFYVDKVPVWLEPLADEDLQDERHRRIVDFFLLHTPVEELSARSRSITTYYQWHNPWKSPVYLNRQLRQASTNFNLVFPAKTCKDVEKAAEDAELKENFPSRLLYERVCIYKKKNHNHFQSVFNHLRNAFAHGRFNISRAENGEKVYVLEDVMNRDKLSARMILKEQTLINWIELIEGGEKNYCKEAKQS